MDTTDTDKITNPKERKYLKDVEEYSETLKVELLNEIGFEKQGDQYVPKSNESLEKLAELIINKLEKEDSQDDYSGSPSGLSNRYPTEEIEDESYEEIAKQYKKFSNAPKFNLNSEELFCICRKPDYGGELMISCDNCDEWFHFK